MVGGHYRQPIVFSPGALEEARRAVGRIEELARRLDPEGPEPQGLDAYVDRFFDALADDFNTPAARAVLFDWVGEANRRADAGERLGVGRLRDILFTIGLEGLLESTGAQTGAPPEVERLLSAREEARAARDFGAADDRRDELRALGWEVRDTPQGPQIVPVR
ncbi:MAG: DALR domain-containing protein [Thermoleophilaceae bacterium]